MLTPTDKDIQDIADMALKADLLTKPTLASDVMERSFIPKISCPQPSRFRRL
jgi:hypothetical protein